MNNGIALKRWLAPYPWSVVVHLNKMSCETGKVIHREKFGGNPSPQKIWEAAVSKDLSLREALEFCRECHRLAPFQFFNGNTFTVVARSIISEVVEILPSTKAHIFKSSVSHYIAGTLEPEAFDGIYRSIEQTVASTPQPQQTP